MIITKGEVKRTSKKLLSVLLAVIMIMSSMSVCFGTISFAAGKDVSVATLADLLKNETVAGAGDKFTGEAYNYKVSDPDGKIFAAVKEYFRVIDEMANKTHTNTEPSEGSSNISKSTKANDKTYRTYNHLNERVKTLLKTEMGADYSNNNIDAFITGLLAGASINEGTKQVTVNNSKVKPGVPSDFPVPTAVKLTVIMESAVTSYPLDENFPEEVSSEQTFTVTHINTNYDYQYTYTPKKTDACTGATTQEENKRHDYYFYYNYSGYSLTESEEKTSTKPITDAADVLGRNAAYFTMTMDQLVATPKKTLTDVSSEVNTAMNSVITTFSQNVFEHFFYKKTEVETLTSNIATATSIQDYLPVAGKIAELAATDYSAYNYSQLTSLYSTLQAEINSYKPAADAVKNYIAGKGFKLADAEAELVAIKKAYQLIEIREAKAVADAHMATYNAYTKQQIADGTLTSAMIGAALSLISADISKLGSYNNDYVTEVCGSDYKSKLNSCKTHLNELATVANYSDRFAAEYAKFSDEIRTLTDITLDDAALLAGLQQYDSWYTGLKALVNEMKTVLGEELANGLMDALDAEMKAHMDEAYKSLNDRLEVQINNAYALFTAFLDDYPDEKVDFKNVSQYNEMKVSIGLINVDVYNFINGSAHFNLSQDAINKYNALQKTFPDFDEFVKSMGFSEFDTVEIEDIVRPDDTIKDIARKNENGEYVVDDDKVLDVIKKIDALLQNEDIKALLGSLINKDKVTGEPTGEPFDIGALIENLIKDKLFTDNMISTIVGMLYPLVVREFVKVWANDLPPTFELKEDKVVTEIFGKEIKVPAQICDVNYVKSLYTILKESPFNVFPDLLASALDNKYADNKALLNAASNQFKEEFDTTTDGYFTLKLDPAGGVKADGKSPREIADKTPWDSEVLKKDALDENGNVIIDEETGKPVKTNEWAFVWGVDAEREKLEAGEITQEQFDNFFYQTFDDAVEGLKPLLFALLANDPWQASEVDTIATLQVKNVTVAGNLDVKAHLTLSATANRGYANLLVPVYEVLGATFKSPETVEGYVDNANAAADILKAILDPIFDFIDKLGENPLDTLLGILPDLCYALVTQMVPALLDMLKTRIEYFGRPTTKYIITLDLNSLAGVNIKGGADISVGSMLNLKDLGIDLTDGLNTLLPLLGISLPQIDQGKIATLGELTTFDSQRKDAIYTNYTNEEFWHFTGQYVEKVIDGKKVQVPVYDYLGKAYHIEANKADVLLYILDYALNNLGDLLSALNIDAGSLGELLNALSENPTLAIAAIAELLTLGKYENSFRNYEWFNGMINGESVLDNSAYETYLNPNNDWTKEKADYLYANLDTLVNAIINLAGIKLGEKADDPTTVAEGEETEAEAQDINAFLGDMIGGLLSDKTLTGLAAVLAGLDLNSLLAGENAAPALDVNALLNSLLGIDLGVFATKYGEIKTALDADENYVHDFGVDSKEKTFAEALLEMLAPLDSVLAFLLEGEDLVIHLKDEVKNDNGEVTEEAVQIVLPGYDGYNNAIVPLLEALGCKIKAVGENETAISVLIATLVAKIDTIKKDSVIKGIIDILPGVFYYIASKGLSVSVRNLLQPVYVILDTIRPIIDVNVNELINGLLPEDMDIMLNIDDIGLEFIFDLLEKLLLKDVDLGTLLDELKALIYDLCNELATTYTSVSTLPGQKEWKKGAYRLEAAEGETTFDQADMLTVILSFVLEWATIEGNAEKLDTLLNTDGLIAKVITVFESADITYGTPEWMYWFKGDEVAFNEHLASNDNLPNTLYALEYPNDWTKASAEYVAENLAEIVDLVIGLVNAEKEDAPATLSALINGLIAENINAQTMNDLVAMITGLLGDIDENLINAAGYLLDVNLAGLKAYTCEAEIKTLSDFINELAKVLDTYASGLVNWLFFGDDYRFAKKSDKEDTIVINGGLGYEKGLALVLEALGCTLPAEANTKTVLEALATRIDYILSDGVDEKGNVTTVADKVLELLPNLIYFLNANGATVAIGNILKPVNALLEKINGLGLLEAPISLADLIKFKVKETDENGNEIEVEYALDLEKLSLGNVVELIETITKLDLTVVEDYLVNFCTGKITKGTHIYKMEAKKADVVTILLTIVLLFVQDEDNAAALDELLNVEFVSALDEVFKSTPVDYITPNYNYFEGEIDYDEGTIEVIKSAIKYPNDWTREKSKYLADNLPALVDTVIKMVEIKGTKYDSLSALLKANVNIFTTETLNDLLGFITNFLGDIDDTLLGLGVILDVNLVDLKAYQVTEGIETVDAFAAELAKILNTFAPGLVDWLLFGDDITLGVSDADGAGEKLEGTDIITINGAQGYAEGLALLLEALGCVDLPEVYGVENLDTAKVVEDVLTALATRINDIFDNPVEEILDLLPNLVYFLNANGVAAVVKNTTGAFNALALKLKSFGLNITLDDLVNIEKLCGIEKDLAIDIDDNLTIPAIIELVSELTGLDLSKLEDVLTGFALGKVTAYTSVSSLGYTAKMEYSEDEDERKFEKQDMLTVLVTAVLLVLDTEGNEEKLNELIGSDIISAIKKVFESTPFNYTDVDWDYCWDENGEATGDSIPVIESAITYPNGWSEGAAAYLAENLESLVNQVVVLVTKDEEATISKLLQDNVNVFTTKNLQAIVDAITGLLGDIDEGLLKAAGVLLGADVVGLKAYKVPEGIDTVDEFATELASVLNTYAKGVVEWLLLGKDYTFFVKDVDENGIAVDAITINGAHGYAEGLALLLEALGCENLPEVYGVENIDTAKLVEDVLGALATRIDEILANPIDEILDILPNLLYFLNANGVAAVIDNLTGALTTLVAKLEGFGIELDLNELVNLPKLMGIEDKGATISLDNLTMADLLEAVSLMTDLDLTVLEDTLVGFALGIINKYDSVSSKDAYKMEYSEDGDKRKFEKQDMLTVLVTAVLLVVNTDGNAEKLDEMIGSDIISAIKTVFTEGEIVYVTPNWDYCWDKTDEDYIYGTIPVIKMALEYPNGWTEEKAQYFAKNLSSLVDMVVALIKKDDSATLAKLLQDNVNVFTTKNLQAIVDLITELLGDIDNGLLKAAGLLLDVNLVDLKAYKVPEGIDTVGEFAEELARVLNTYAKGVVEWLLFGKDYTFFVKDVDKNGLPVDFITINGAHGYAEGLALLLEALGCKNIPAVYGVENLDATKMVEDILTSLAKRISEIFANPVDEIMNLLPNIIYFLNANGVAAVIDNLTAALTALSGKLEAFGIKLDINSLVNLPKLLGIEDKYAEGERRISLDNLAMKDILKALTLKTDLDLTVLEGLLVGFALGHCQAYTSVSKSSYETFKMVYETNFKNHDMLTVLVTALLLVAQAEGNAEKLDKMIGSDIISAINDVFGGGTVVYSSPEWDYCKDGPVVNGTFGVIDSAIKYPNNWTEATAKYVTDNLVELGDIVAGLIDSNYTTLSALLKDKVNVFTSANLQKLVDLIADLLKDIDDGLLKAAGVLLDADIIGLQNYTVKAGITTVDAFAAELAYILNEFAPGIVEWLLLGKDYRFFVNNSLIDDKEYQEGEDIIVITGAHGYAEGLALLLEALGCENLPETYNVENLDSAKVIEDVLKAVAARINEIFNNPVEEIIDLLPNLFYFLNTNGVAAVVDNLTAALTALLGKLEVFGIELDINALVNLQKLMGIEGKGATIDLDNLAMKDILQAVTLMTGFDITYIEEALVGFALGQVSEYDSLSKNAAYKMGYKDEYDKHDMVTVVANLALLTLADEDNAEFVKKLVGDEIYGVILDILNLTEKPAPIVKMSWKEVPDKVGQTFNAMETSELYEGYGYGPRYTREMAQYIADNIGTFIDNIIYLLGIQIDGKNVDDLTSLLNGLINGNLYNSANVIAIRDALVNFAKGISELKVDGKVVGNHIVEILKTAEIADLNALANVKVPEFEEDKAKFIEYLCDVLEPLYPVLNWLLAKENLAFFVDTDKGDFITLPGAEGYKNGIVLLLEALGCDVTAPEDYYKDIESGNKDAIITSILTPVLARLDEIIENPAEEILEILPNLIYFINSNGIDVVVKNTLGAVYTVLNAIKPIAEIDLYEIIGLDLSTITFEKILDMILKNFEIAGFNFTGIPMDTFAELTIGRLEAYDSYSAEDPAYRMVYQAETAKADMVTVILRLVITFVLTENNRAVLVDLLKSELGMSADAEKYVAALLKALADCTIDNQLGMDSALATIYYVYYGADLGVGNVADGKKDINEAWKNKLKELGHSDNKNEQSVGNLITDILDIIFNDEGKVPEGGGNDVLDQDGVASNGFLAFFARIKIFFQEIADFFKNLFSFGR